jgi:hypothetical protein
MQVDMKNFTILFFCCFAAVCTWAHGLEHGTEGLKQWTILGEKSPIAGSFLMLKAHEIYLEDAQHRILHFPITAFSEADQAFAKEKHAQIEHLNKAILQVAPLAPTTKDNGFIGAMVLFGIALVLCAGWLFFAPKQTKLALAVFSLCTLAGLYSFKAQIEAVCFGTDPAFIDSAFIPFKPAVNTHWDNTYFYVESKGIPSHPMMSGITGWQQQVPIPQCYIGANAWSIPLNPEIAATPVPVSPQHFLRGAIAIAANGVAIFNPYTNTGVDAKLDGQLDVYGGHCGRADDYHYHTAPMFLDSQSVDIVPIAFALDGFAVYAGKEPNGSPMSALDANHGHYGANGVYHYHGSENAPYMIGNMVGKVTEDNTLQIIPQASAQPIRPAGTPLQGAVITNCIPIGSNGYKLNYVRNGQNYAVDYSWTNNGVYTFNFISPTATTTSTYNGFVPCLVPTAVEDINTAKGFEIFPNPSSGGFALKLGESLNINDLQTITMFDLQGKLVYAYKAGTQMVEGLTLPKGVYLVKLQFNGFQLTRKVILQ